MATTNFLLTKLCKCSLFNLAKKNLLAENCKIAIFGLHFIKKVSFVQSTYKIFMISYNFNFKQLTKNLTISHFFFVRT